MHMQQKKCKQKVYVKNENNLFKKKKKTLSPNPMVGPEHIRNHHFLTLSLSSFIIFQESSKMNAVLIKYNLQI